MEDEMDMEDCFENMHAEELEMMKEQEQEATWIKEMADHIENIKDSKTQYKSMRSLDFSKEICPDKVASQTYSTEKQKFGTSSKKRILEQPAESKNKKSRMELEENMESLCVPISPPQILRKRIPNNDFISVTGYDGSIIYVNVTTRPAVAKVPKYKQLNSHILGVSLASLKAQLISDEVEKIKIPARESIHSTKELEHSGLVSLSKEQNGGNENLSRNKNSAGKLLWVDKYAPKKYPDLISEEATNRNLLRWLKLWDFSSFGMEAKVSEKRNENIPKIIKNNKANELQSDESMSELDKNKRPVYKVALVSGPPGLGKTTLAHVIAKHAGYNVVEMNASDDRTVEIFRERIEAATQMKSVLGELNPRPNCLIIDEIDGAPQPTIEVLLNVIKKSDASNVPTKTTQRKKKEVALLRPIICICNDLYVPSLRQLRQVCYLVSFHAPPISNLVGRLFEISKHERIKTDSTALVALCEKAENDIRSCINTLQFIKSKHGRELSASIVSSLDLGQKDFHRSLLAVLQSIFTLPKPIQPRYVNPNDRVDDDAATSNYWEASKRAVTQSERSRNILQILSSADDGKLQQGLFENYLLTTIKDPRMKSISQAIDWLCFADFVESHISSLQNYSLMKHIPFVPVLFHLLFAVNRPHRIVFPRAHFEFQTNLSCLRELLMTHFHGSPPSIQSCLAMDACAFDIIPHICDIINPTLRSVNIQLFTTHEKEALSQVVKIMMAYNLSYKQEKNAEGQYHYLLEPNIEKLVCFSDTKFSKHMNYSCKQMISREIVLEKMRRSDQSESTRKVPPANPATLNRAKQTFQPKPIKEAKGAVDFFGRKIIKPSNFETSASSREEETASIFGQVWYKYKEGFSNAVKRSVKVKDFL